MFLISVAIALASYTDPCPPKDPESIHPTIPYEFPNEYDEHACWNAYLSTVAQAKVNYWACINAIPPTSPNLCAQRAICEGIYDAYLDGADYGYFKCVNGL